MREVKWCDIYAMQRWLRVTSRTLPLRLDNVTGEDDTNSAHRYTNDIRVSDVSRLKSQGQ